MFLNNIIDLLNKVLYKLIERIEDCSEILDIPVM